MTVTVSICECPVFSRRRQLILTVEIVARVVNAEDGLAADICNYLRHLQESAILASKISDMEPRVAVVA